MSNPGTCSDTVILGGKGQEAEADGDPPNAEPRPPCTEQEAQSAAKQPALSEGMEIEDFNQPATCTETLTAVSEDQDAGEIPDKGDIIVSRYLSLQFCRIS